MRDYSKVSPQFWIGKTGKALRKKGAEALVVGMYLMTAPNSNMLGLYYLDMPTIAHQTGLGLEGASKGLQGCIEAGFCAYDHDAEVVWVYEMAAYQIASQLKPDDKRCIGVQNEYNEIPENQYLRAFYEKYAKAFHMSSMRTDGSPFEVPSKPLASQEQEQEKEQEQKQEQKQENNLVGQNQPDPVPEIFAYWQRVMNSPKSVLDGNRKNTIKKALKIYSPADICKAIRGCSKSPFHMGQNDRKTKYNGLHLILRSAEYIDRFIELDSGEAATAGETIEQRNARITAQFLGEPIDDYNTIEMEV